MPPFTKHLSFSSVLGGALIVLGLSLSQPAFREGNERLANLDSIMEEVVIYDDPSKMKEFNEKLVIVTGTVMPHGNLSDPEFSLEIPVLKLFRESKIFQWHKWNRKSVNVRKVWVHSPLKSPDSEHANRGVIAYPNRFVVAEEINIVHDGFKLASIEPSYAQFMNDEVKLILSDDEYRNIPPEARLRYDLVDGSLMEKSTAAGDPRIGDNMTEFRIVLPYEATVVGLLVDGKVISVDRKMREVGLFLPGKFTPAEVRQQIAKRIYYETMNSLTAVGVLMVLFGVVWSIKDIRRARRIYDRDKFRKTQSVGR